MNIGFACEWKKQREQTWSHTPVSLLQGLRQHSAHTIHDIDLRLPGWMEYLLKIATLRYNPRIQRWKTSYLYSPLHDRLMEYSLRTKSAAIPNLDAVISMGDYGSVHPLPQYVYFDVSMAEYAQINTHERYGQNEILRLDEESIRQRVQRQQVLFEQCAGLFAMSRHAADEFLRLSGMPSEKVHVVHAGVNTIVQSKENTTSPVDAPFLLFAGRDFRRKGGDIVLQAFPLLRRQHPELKLVIAGPRQWEWGDIPEGVIYLGDIARTQLQGYFRHAKAYVMPSRYEAYGIAFAEALCFGLPVIARNAFAMKEIVEHGRNGYLMEQDSDSAEELAQLINKALANSDMQRYVQEHREEYQRYYSWQRVAEDMLAIISRDKNKRGAGAGIAA